MSVRKEKRHFTKEFKKQVVELHVLGGKKKADILREYELSSSLLDRWIRQYKNNESFTAKDNRTAEENELIGLRKKNKQLEMENDILKQAALIMGRK